MEARVWPWLQLEGNSPPLTSLQTNFCRDKRHRFITGLICSGSQQRQVARGRHGVNMETNLMMLKMRSSAHGVCAASQLRLGQITRALESRERRRRSAST